MLGGSSQSVLEPLLAAVSSRGAQRKACSHWVQACKPILKLELHLPLGNIKLELANLAAPRQQPLLFCDY